MKNLGKIILLLFLCAPAIYASVVASVSDKSIAVGDMVTYNLAITGENIKRPQINRLCESDVISSASQTSIQMINGDYKKNYTLSYKFMPQKSCEITPIEVEINGKTELSNAVNIEVKATDVAKDSDFVLTLISSKKEVYVGEPFELTILLKQKQNAEAVDSKFIAPELKGFWIKSESKPERLEEDECTITKLSYMMSPQREGNIKITPAQLRIASRSNTRDSWGAWVANLKWRTYFSNEISLDVKPLPAGLDLVGDFTIEAIADKNEINANEAVNVTLRVKGKGNLEDIKTFKPYIEGVSVFDEKINIQNSTLSQKMAFVADKDFVIPPFELRFFNPENKEIKTVSTKEIHIKVKNASPQAELLIKREEQPKIEPVQTVQKEFDTLWAVLTFMLGLACGMIIVYLKPWSYFRKEKKLSIKEPKTLLVKLLPYKNDEKVREIIEILEKNIYENANLEYDKKALKECLKKYSLI
ncbi:MAG: oxygen-tolerance protein [Helicobacteraceae bacterium CG2_30_36_10]|nr:MAG: oxygen-tolerance protein [Helicobacteraceae bacterium CG2_30_36_10]